MSQIENNEELIRYDISLFCNGVVEMGGGKYVLYEDAVSAISRARHETIKDCAKIAYNWRTASVTGTGERIAKAIVSLLCSAKYGGNGNDL